MTYQEVLENAKKRMSPKCYVCPECNGIACKGILPGPAGKGTARTFRRNFSYLAEQVWIHMDVVGEECERDTSITLFGKAFSAPIFCAPIGGMSFNYTECMTEGEYADAVMQGTKAAGTVAFGGGGLQDVHFYAPLEAIRDNGGWGIPTLKPWAMETVRERIRIMEEYRPFAFAMDIDSAGLPHAGNSLLRMEMKTAENLKEIATYSKLPFVVKGVMTTEAAVQAADAGAYALVVSNHGGRVLDYGLSTAEVLPEIRKAVGGRVKVFVDGGVRTGGDVFKMLALGADAVLIGRPYAIAAYGGGAEGVQLYTEKLIGELKDAMKMSGCGTLEEINMDKIRLV